MSAPKWATELLERVIVDEGYAGPVTLSWRRSGTMRVVVRSKDDWPRSAIVRKRPPQSSGHATYATDEREARIVVTAGDSRKDQKLVLLHEIAHVLTPKHHHDAQFWDKAWELYRRYGVPIRYARDREKNYRKGAMTAYKRRRKLVVDTPTV